MNRFKHILLATDINSDEKEHLESAIEFARKQQAVVSMVHILPNKALHSNLKEETAKQVIEILEKRRDEIKRQGIQEVEIHLEYGDVAPAIVNAAKKLGADAIMLYEKNADTKHLLSSIVGKVIRLSPVPVWTTLKGSKKEIKKILCPVDCSPASKEALNVALNLSRFYNASVDVLFVFEPTVHVPMFVKVNLEEINREEKAQAERQLSAFVQSFDTASFSCELCEGKPSSKILEKISEYQLLIMGTTGRTGMSRFVMGSVTETVIRNATCTFVTTHSQNILPERLEEELTKIESHFKSGIALINAQKLKESEKEFMECLRIDVFYAPALIKLSEVQQKLGNTQKAKHFQRQAETVLERLWGKTLTDEILKTFTTQ